MRARTSLLCVAMILLGAELLEPVHAYLDPGTGSMIIQTVVAGVVGVLAVGRLYWTRLKGLVRRTPVREGDGE